MASFLVALKRPLAWAGMACLAGAAWTDVQAAPAERLSTWLLQNDATQDHNTAYPEGLLWQVDAEQPRQQALKDALLRHAMHPGLHAWLQQLPITGRATVALADPVWLLAHPNQDPALGQDSRVRLPQRPRTVTLVLEDGRICQIPHQPGALAYEYLPQCVSDTDRRDVAWLVQPDGKQMHFGIGRWNAQAQQPPEPGAWLWAPTGNSGWKEQESTLLMQFLATQGIAEDGLPGSYATPAIPKLITPEPERNQNLAVSASDWGEIGLLQTPTARMAPAGSARVHLSHVQPYTRMTTMMQPLDWLEGGFRYSSISGAAYDPSGQISSQDLKDKSIDIKIRLWRERRYLPQVALGVRDLGGTGLFAGEYLVASKRSGNFDWSLGLGWGYLGARADFSNPLYPHRPQEGSVSGGQTNIQSMFHGPIAIFGGVQWQSPLRPWLLKMELDGSNYKNEPAGRKDLGQKLPLNFGAVYRYGRNTDISIGLERGNKIMLGLTFHGNLSQAGTVKPFDPPAPVVSTAMPQAQPDWTATAQLLTKTTGWTMQSLSQRDGELRVQLEDNNSIYRQEREQKALAVLHSVAPADIDRVTLDFSHHGLPVESRSVERSQWVQQHTTALSPAQRSADGKPHSVGFPDEKISEPQLLAKPWKFDVAPSFWQSFGGPDAFMLYQLGMQANGEWRFTPRTWISGSANLRLLDNYDKFKYTAPSNLPRVRTNVREYVTQSRLTIDNLQLTHAQALGKNNFVSIYGGFLESMYAGVGAEWLYRPLGSRLAFGMDINHVRQRGFKQDFSLRDYQVSTGHASIYWDTGWNQVLAKLSIGQYLAKDKGATLDLSRTFNNGVTMGVWATKTNVSAVQFGEGSFDKGIYLRVPFDVMLPRSTTASGRFNWQPLLRDGGARLNRTVQLYDMTAARDQNAFEYQLTPNNAPTVPETGADIFSPVQ